MSASRMIAIPFDDLEAIANHVDAGILALADLLQVVPLEDAQPDVVTAMHRLGSARVALRGTLASANMGVA